MNAELNKRIAKDWQSDVFGVKHRTYYLKARFDEKLTYSLYHYGTLILTIETAKMSDLPDAKCMAWIYSASDQNAVNALLEVLGIKGFRFNRKGLNTIKEEI